MNLFIDECGDLGFSEKSTKFFVVSFLLTRNSWGIRIETRRLLKSLREKKLYKHDELKFTKASHKVKLTILEKICSFDCDFGFVILSKRKVHDHLREDLNLLYRFVVIDPLMNMILPFLDEAEKLSVTIDKSVSEEKLQYEFNNYLQLKGYYYSKVIDRQVPLHRSQVTTNHIDSQIEPCLQITDCLAGSEFQRFERGKYDYHNILNKKIKPELFRFLW